MPWNNSASRLKIRADLVEMKVVSYVVIEINGQKAVIETDRVLDVLRNVTLNGGDLHLDFDDPLCSVVFTRQEQIDDFIDRLKGLRDRANGKSPEPLLCATDDEYTIVRF